MRAGTRSTRCRSLPRSHCLSSLSVRQHRRHGSISASIVPTMTMTTMVVVVIFRCLRRGSATIVLIRAGGEKEMMLPWGGCGGVAAHQQRWANKKAGRCSAGGGGKQRKITQNVFSINHCFPVQRKPRNTKHLLAYLGRSEKRSVCLPH